MTDHSIIAEPGTGSIQSGKRSRSDAAEPASKRTCTGSTQAVKRPLSDAAEPASKRTCFSAPAVTAEPEPSIIVVPDTCSLAAFLECGSWYHIDTRWENVPTSKCNLCNCPITESTRYRCERPVALYLEGKGGYSVIPQLNLCNQCCTKVYDNSNVVGSFYSRKNYFMGKGRNYKEIIQSVRRKYNISAVPVTTSLMALNRLGMDTDLIDEGFFYPG